MSTAQGSDKFSPGSWLDEFYGFRYRGRLALIALLLFLIFTALFLISDPLFRAAADPSLIDLQLCASSTCFHDIIVRWNKSVAGGVEIYKLSIILLDYIYPVLYSLMFAFAYAAARGNQYPSSGDRVLFILPAVGALGDYVENTLHLYLLRGVHNADGALLASYPPALVAASYISSLLKFFFFYAATIAIVAAVLYRLKRKFSR